MIRRLIKSLFILLLIVGCLCAKNLPSKLEIEKLSKEQKMSLYDKHRIKPFNNILISYVVPTLGHHRINQGDKSINIYKYGLGISFIVFGFLEMSGQGSEVPYGYFSLMPTEFNFITSFYLIHFWQLFDVGKQTKKYNENLYKSIFGKEPPKISLELQPDFNGLNLSMTYSLK